MNKTCCYTVLAAGLAAQLTYSEAYAEKLIGSGPGFTDMVCTLKIGRDQ